MVQASAWVHRAPMEHQRRAKKCAVPGSANDLLEGSDFADSYRIVTHGQGLDALCAAHRAMGRSPPWVNALMRLRNLVVMPLGLKGGAGNHAGGKQVSGKSQPVGFFPVLAQSPDRVVLGLDDRHLDFRLVVDVCDLQDGKQGITATTIVRTHNLAGRLYLAIVKPFHRIIVPAMLAQAGSHPG